jgi:hypothetical protein
VQTCDERRNLAHERLMKSTPINIEIKSCQMFHKNVVGIHLKNIACTYESFDKLSQDKL